MLSAPDAGRWALGVDVGNAKIKLCLAREGSSEVRWTSRRLPYDARRRYQRHQDFERGIPEAVTDFVGDRQVAVAAAVMTNGYAYPSYAEGALHTLRRLEAALPAAACYALCSDAVLRGADELAAEPDRLARAPFTNGAGAAHLARRAGMRDGLAIDTGGDTTQIVPLVAGEVDPAAHADERGQVDHRSRHGKFVWLGSQTTPLEHLAHEVEVAGRRYPVVPRGVTFDHVSSLLELLEPELAGKLSLFGLHPDKELARRALCDAVNLDPTMLSPPEIEALARSFFDAAVSRLASEIRRALATLPPACGRRAMLFGLGAELTRPALLAAGVPEEGLLRGRDRMPEELAIAASVYGACHAALERVHGSELPVDPAHWLQTAEPTGA